MSFIGEKKIVTTEETGELTPGNAKLIKVVYEDGSAERFSSIMYEKIVSEESCTLEVLRDKRLQPVVSVLLAVLREWGVKFNELGYISALLNRSLEFNKDSAIRELLSVWMPMPLAPDDVDLIVVDRILRSKDANKKSE